MEIKDSIHIANDFSRNPGARYRSEGDNSGEEFLELLLVPKIEIAIKNKYKILIDLDGVIGLPSSFVSGSFGKLSVEIGSEKLLKHLYFKSDKNPIRIDKIIDEIKNPHKK